MGVAKSANRQRNTFGKRLPEANVLKIATPPMRNANVHCYVRQVRPGRMDGHNRVPHSYVELLELSLERGALFGSGSDGEKELYAHIKV